MQPLLFVLFSICTSVYSMDFLSDKKETELHKNKVHAFDDWDPSLSDDLSIEKPRKQYASSSLLDTPCFNLSSKASESRSSNNEKLSLDEKLKTIFESLVLLNFVAKCSNSNTVIDSSHAQLSDFRSLDLSNKGIKEVAFDSATLLGMIGINLDLKVKLVDFTNHKQVIRLTKLDLSHNQINTLPKEFFTLETVEQLYLKDNCITNIDPIIQLSNLQELDLSHNVLISLPEAIDTLSHLKDLNLENNQLNKLPNRIMSLVNLRKLELGNNVNLALTDNQLKQLTNLPFLQREGLLIFKPS